MRMERELECCASASGHLSTTSTNQAQQATSLLRICLGSRRQHKPMRRHSSSVHDVDPATLLRLRATLGRTRSIIDKTNTTACFLTQSPPPPIHPAPGAAPKSLPQARLP